MLVFSATLMSLVIGQAAIPPAPADDAILAKLLMERPGAVVESASFHDLANGSARVACGRFYLNGVIEPFAILTTWDDRPPVTIVAAGEPPPPPPASIWRIRLAAPYGASGSLGGLVNRWSLNSDALDRRLALTICEQTSPIAPPEGVEWQVEQEPSGG